MCPIHGQTPVDFVNLNQQAADGHRLVACSDGQRLCVLEKTSEPLAGDAYLALATAQIPTFEKELNEAGRRGYRLHPGAFGVEGEGILITEVV